MSDSRDVQWTIAVVIFALCYAATFVAIKLSAAQEKDSSYPPTRQWQLGQIYGNGTYANGAVVVFDTAGVCLYVVTGTVYGSTYGGGGQVHSIAAVPKTQLPKGAGCQ